MCKRRLRPHAILQPYTLPCNRTPYLATLPRTEQAIPLSRPHSQSQLPQHAGASITRSASFEEAIRRTSEVLPTAEYVNVCPPPPPPFGGVCFFFFFGGGGGGEGSSSPQSLTILCLGLTTPAFEVVAPVLVTVEYAESFTA